MRAFLALGFVVAVFIGVTITHRNAVKAAARVKPTGIEEAADPRREVSKEDRAAARKFDLDIKTVRPNGEAIALAASYDIAPAVTTSPEKLPKEKSAWTQAGQIYISGLPAGLVDGQNGKAWLTRTGTKTYIDPQGRSHTIPAYSVVPTPPTVENKPKSGAWMYEGSTALDLRTSASKLH